VLVVLALGSVLAGYVGVPHALGGHNQLAAWLAPSFAAPTSEIAGGLQAGEAEAADTPGEVAGGLQASGDDEAALELTLMGVSSAIALLGIGIAAFIWLKRREIAASMASHHPGLHRLLLNKYYVDEFYDATLVQPIHVASQEGLWRGFDVRVIDGAVDGTGAIVASSASVLRRLQTGSVRAYASSMFVGVVVILGYYLWR
ncbi:MAG TPA: hypothetical protein VES36_01300, partial [Candidatus Limnocylindrales bacterium]|nr:hypothetical protein [Candidatus Limnocylindrales bacterium]